MDIETYDEQIANAINNLTQKVSEVMLQEFLKLPATSQINLVLIKSAQLLLANILCQVVSNKEELTKVADAQGPELKELTINCAFSGFADKFEAHKH